MQMKNENQNKMKEKMFQKEIQKELFAQTFQEREAEFSADKIDHLVGLLEMENPTDMQEVLEAQNRFEKTFRQMHRKEIRKNHMELYCRKGLKAAAVFLLILLTADVTTKAVMDDRLFHMMSRQVNQLEIRPSEEEAESESTDFTEESVEEFTSMDEFAEYFKEDFLICTCLPDEVELKRITLNSEDVFAGIVFEYHCRGIQDWNLQIWMYQNITSDNAGVAGNFEFDTAEDDYVENMKVTYYQEGEGLLVGFESNGYWYLIDASSNEKQVLADIVEGMRRYEKKME